jgi:fucose 4-O-acetylase-like acetyltransferase
MAVRRWFMSFLATSIVLGASGVAYADAISPYAFFWSGVGTINPILAFPASLLAAFVERPFLTAAGLEGRALVLSLRANFLSAIVGIVLIPVAIPALYVLGPFWYLAAFVTSVVVEGEYLRRFDARLGLPVAFVSSVLLLGIEPAATVIDANYEAADQLMAPHGLWLTCVSLVVSLAVFLSSFAACGLW